MTQSEMALACQRDPSNPHELRETEVALQVLLDDGLAEHQGENEGEYDGEGESERFKPTRAAIRAAELSF